MADRESSLTRDSPPLAPWSADPFTDPETGLDMGDEIDAVWHYLSQPEDPPGFWHDKESGIDYLDALGLFLRDNPGIQWDPYTRAPGRGLEQIRALRKGRVTEAASNAGAETSTGTVDVVCKTAVAQTAGSSAEGASGVRRRKFSVAGLSPDSRSHKKQKLRRKKRKVINPDAVDSEDPETSVTESDTDADATETDTGSEG
ncbi:hypothetical protein B0H17DRAFT_1186010 [Mycena rosella]|uniref:Uncharacterized protein n=1 Tax=Mycena rosella TaxID=1033263 RepID=A0AAD7G4V7_MYCRO|nr:hypothetical protein B0H17DRAFT_1186010 [Mycena rosella]